MEIIKLHKDGVLLSVLLKPRSSKDAVLGVHNNAIKISLTAPPVDGKANQCLIDFLSKKLDLAKSCIKIIKGEKSKNKVLLIRTANADKISEIIEPKKNQ